MSENESAPHAWSPVGRWWQLRKRLICRHCYGPRSLHPRRGWVKSRPVGDRTYLGPAAPHFKEGW